MKRKETELQKMRRRVGQKIRRMTIQECLDWCAEYNEAVLSDDHITAGIMVSEITGCSEPSRSQNIRSYVNHKVFDKVRGRK
jgi:hypothetical protein